MAFLPAGGVIDRLGDTREKLREKARESLVILGGMAFRSGGVGASSTLARSKEGKGPETPMMIFERYLREVGLGSKVWRAREQVRWGNAVIHLHGHSNLTCASSFRNVIFIYLLSASVVDSHPSSYSSDTSPLSHSALPTAIGRNPRGYGWHRA